MKNENYLIENLRRQLYGPDWMDVVVGVTFFLVKWFCIGAIISFTWSIFN